MKLKRREIGYFALLTALTLFCKQTVFDTIENKFGLHMQISTKYLKLAGFILNVLMGYIGLIKHEVNWTKTAWLSIYGILLLIIATDKITFYTFNHSLMNFDHSLFASPVFYLAACILPRYVSLENVNLNRPNPD